MYSIEKRGPGLEKPVNTREAPFTDTPVARGAAACRLAIGIIRAGFSQNRD